MSIMSETPAAVAERSSDRKREMLKQLLAGRAGAQLPGARAAQPIKAKAEIPAEFHRFDLHPGYLHLRKMEENAERQGFRYPFFKAHEGIARGTTVIDGREYINYSSYNYLDISGNPIAATAVKAAIDRYGTSVSASRLLAGERRSRPSSNAASPTFSGPMTASSWSAGTPPTSRRSAICSGRRICFCTTS